MSVSLAGYFSWIHCKIKKLALCQHFSWWVVFFFSFCASHSYIYMFYLLHRVCYRNSNFFSYSFHFYEIFTYWLSLCSRYSSGCLGYITEWNKDVYACREIFIASTNMCVEIRNNMGNQALFFHKIGLSVFQKKKNLLNYSH